MSVIEGAGAFELGGVGRPRWALWEYDFAKDGGTIGDIILRGPNLPAGAIAVDALLVVETILAGATATVAVKLEGAADVQAAAAISGAPWSTATPKRASALTATGAPIKTTVARKVTFTVATAALTAGKVKVLVAYVEVK